MSISSGAVQRIEAAVFAVLLAGFVVLAIVLDVVFAGGWKPGVLLLFALLSAPALVYALPFKRRTCTYGIAWLAVLAMFFTPWHPRKQFVHDLQALRPGMTRSEVQQAMVGYEFRREATWTGPCPYGPNPGGPGDLQLSYSWHSAEYRADIGAITFDAGRLVNTEFWPD